MAFTSLFLTVVIRTITLVLVLQAGNKPAAAGAFYYLGFCRERKGEFKKAVLAWRKAVEINPQIEQEISNLKDEVSGVERNLRQLITGLEKMLEEVHKHMGDKEQLAKEISGLKSDMLKRIEEGDAVWQRKQTQYQQKMSQLLESEYEKKGEEIEELRRRLEIETKQFGQEFQ